MNNLDSIQRFIFENADIRGEIIRLDTSFQQIVQQHQYPEHINELLGEALVAAALLCSIIKFKGELTLQFRGNGAVKMLVAKCNHQFHLRGLVQFTPAATPDEIKKEIGDGQLVVTIQPDDQVQPYQSIIPVKHLSLARCLEEYFAQSEQLATRLFFATRTDRAAGMLLQLLPETSVADREIFWEHAVKIGETLTKDELLILDNETILHRLYHQEKIRLFAEIPVIFRCTCSREKMEDAIKTLGVKEAMAEIQDKKKIIVTCEFCNTHFEFDKAEVEALFSKP